MIGDLWLFDTLDCNGKLTMHRHTAKDASFFARLYDG